MDGRGAVNQNHQSSPKRRRRGARLEADIFAATLAEMCAVGYADLTFDGVARRAGTGRMSLYHRWAGKPQLVAATLRHALPPLATPSPEQQGTLREELRAVLMSMFRTVDDRPIIIIVEVAAALLAENADDELATVLREEILGQRIAQLTRVFEHAQTRGELAATADTVLLARCGPALLFQQVLLSGKLPTDDDVDQVIDTLIIPATDAHRTDPPDTPTPRGDGPAIPRPDAAQ